MNADQLPDFVQPLTVREKGFRVVYEPRALLYEDALADTGDEFRMRVRVILRAWHGLRDMAGLVGSAQETETLARSVEAHLKAFLGE